MSVDCRACLLCIWVCLNCLCSRLILNAEREGFQSVLPESAQLTVQYIFIPAVRSFGAATQTIM